MSSFEHDSLAQLEARPATPAGETRVVARDFLEVMRLQQPKPVVQPPANGGGNVNAATAWHAAISGKGTELLDVIDRRAAASQWLGQSFVSNEDAARKVIVAKAIAERDARLAAAAAEPTAGVSPNERVSEEHLASSDEPTASKKRGWLK